MKSIKAVIAGCLFIVLVILLLQLVYIFIAVGYNALAQDFPLLNDISKYFRYIIGIPVFVAIMFTGGYVTASIANIHSSSKVWLNSITVGLITVGGMMYSAMENASLTVTGIVVAVLALSATSAGGLYWLRGNKPGD